MTAKQLSLEAAQISRPQCTHAGKYTTRREKERSPTPAAPWTHWKTAGSAAGAKSRGVTSL